MPDTAVRWTENTITVNTNSAGSQRAPKIIQLDNGDIIVAWETEDPSGGGNLPGFDIMAQRFDQAGNMIGTEFRQNTYIVGDQGDFSLVNIPGDQFHIIYEDTDNGVTRLRMSRLNDDGTYTDGLTGITIASDGSVDNPNYRNPEIAASSDTEALIVYEVTDATGGDVYYRTLNPTTFVTGAQTSLISGTSITDPSITTLSNGNFVITATVGGADDYIAMRIVDAGGSNILGVTGVADTSSNGDTDSGARVEALTGGGFVVAWENVDSSDRDIEFQIYDSAGATVGTRKTMAAPPPLNNDNFTDLSITRLSDGGFVILADNQTSGEFDLVMQRYDSSGAAVGSIITLSDLNESGIDITLLADGRMALVYSNGADIRMEIFDTRDADSAGLGNIRIGTTGDDVINETDVGAGRGIFAGLGNDSVTISTIALNGDAFDGGAGIDSLVLETQTSDNYIDLEQGVRYRTSSPTIVDSVTNFENAAGSNGNDAIYGTDGANTLIGFGGNDVLWGRGGFDTMIGGTGDDVYLLDEMGDIVHENLGEGTDTVYTTIFIGYTLAANIEIGVDQTTGTAGNTLTGNTLDNVLILTNTAATGASTVNGDAGNDTIYVQSFATVNGDSGNDSIVLNGNNNVAQGGSNDDTYIIIGTDNTVNELAGQGNDTVYSYAASFTIGENIETIALITFDAGFAQNATGNSTANTMIGGGSNNILAGLGGGDFILGGGGDDILIGGEGLDVMQGNVGNDIFFYNGFAELGDVIQDWVNTDDSFYFSGLAFGVGAGTSLVDGVNFISSTGPFSVAAQATFLWDSDDYDLYYDADGTGTAVNAVLVASLQDFTTVDVSDFVFF